MMARACVLIVLMSVAVGCASDNDLGTRPAQKVEGPPKALYERLGREQGIRRIVDDLLPRLLANKRLNFRREGVGKAFEATVENVSQLKRRLVYFIISATGGPKIYDGRDMWSVHMNMKITGGQFDLMMREVKATLKHLKVKEQEQKDLFKVLEGTRRDIVEVP